MVTKTSRYALQALVFIATCQKGEYLLTKQIAAALNIPKEYLSKVLRSLVRGKFVKSLKGPQGGFQLACDPRAITIYDVMKEIEGTDLFESCILRAEECNEQNPCALHVYWSKICTQLRTVLDRVTLYELMNDMKDGKRVLQFADNPFLVDDFKSRIGIR